MTADSALKPLMIADLKAGDTVFLDDSFTCRPGGPVVLEEDEHGLFFRCIGADPQGPNPPLTEKHYLDGQDHGPDGGLVGVSIQDPEQIAYAAFYASIKLAIETHGQMVLGVSGGADSLPFCYTIGNAAHDLPEFLVIGNFPPDIIAMALNTLCKTVREAQAPVEEGFIDIGWTYPMKVRHASPAVKSQYTTQTGRFLGHEDYTVMQAMICDKAGKWPGEPGCDPNFDVPQP